MRELCLLGPLLLQVLSSIFPNNPVEGITCLPPYGTYTEHRGGRSHKDLGGQNQVSKSSQQVRDLAGDDREWGVKCRVLLSGRIREMLKLQAG